jgi:lysophospholipase L1-like esterase
MRAWLLAGGFIITSLFGSGQPYGDDLSTDSVMGIIDTSVLRKYPFIRFGNNVYSFYSESSPGFERFYEKFDSLINYRRGQVKVYHIGGSHIQADIYSNRMRTYLNSFWPGLKGARGLIFPFTAASTNNPGNYRIDATGEWTSVRCVMKKDTSRLGLLGISISTKDTLNQLRIYYREKELMPYLHTRVKVYHNTENKSYEIQFADPENVMRVVRDTIGGFTQFELKEPVSEMMINIVKTGTDTGSFTLYGIELMNDQPGVVYNSIGINGAAFYNYLRCQDFEKQLAQLAPDLFIISIGTNDANVTESEFDPEEFKRNYETLIKKVLNVNPNAAILLTVPNDAYYYRKYANKNVARMREVIIDLAGKYQAAVWDFYGVMGELGSSNQWYKEGLMHKDRIHFTLEGYNLKGDLFFEAFLKFLEEFEYRKLVKLSNRD